MQGVISLVLLYFTGITYASIAGFGGPQTVEEKPEYYPNPQTFGRRQDPAYKQYEGQQFARPQAYAPFKPQAYAPFKPQASQYNRLQAPQYDQPQASAYSQPEAQEPQAPRYATTPEEYNRYQPTPYDQSKLAEYQRQYYKFAQEQRDREEQQEAYYKKLEEEQAEEDAKPAPTPAPTKPPAPPTPRTSCPGNCPKWCVPRCNVECCNPKPPPMPEYLQRQQLTASACEGHKLKIKCPNRSDRIIMYSSFYGREKDGNTTCQHDVLPSKGTCNEQEHHVNEKVYNLCGHENRCEVAVNNKFLANDNTTICPGVYKYLKVIYKCSQHPKIFPICPLPCKDTRHCFPKCTKKCCSPRHPSPSKAVEPATPQPALTCPAPCPTQCKPPCTPQCCYKGLRRDEIRAYLYGSKPQPKPEVPDRFNDQYPVQNDYYANPYSSYQTQQNQLTNYKDQRSNCPAACSQTCALNCPPECCSSTPKQQYAYGQQAVNYYG